jgi:shikimate kinase
MDFYKDLEFIDNTTYVIYQPDMLYILENKQKYRDCLNFLLKMYNETYLNKTSRTGKYRIIMAKNEIQILFESRNRLYNYIKNYIQTSAENEYNNYLIKYYVRKLDFHQYSYTPYISLFI